jgi:murein DD-endopeptidase MepM/ murein hydrolase activator NlpD
MATRSRLVCFGLALILLTTTSCTQAPAQVELKGHQIFGRNGVVEGNSYQAASASTYKAPISYQSASQSSVTTSRIVPQNTQQTANVESIGVSDLPPPSATAKAPAIQASTQVAKVENKPVNLWTGKPRTEETDAENMADMKPAAGKAPEKPLAMTEKKTANSPVNQLDSIISNDTPVTKQATTIQPDKAVQTSGFMWPVNSKKVVSAFGPKGGGRVNDGINIASAEGEPVWAADEGEIVFAGDELKGYGNMILLKHKDGKTTTYAHLNRMTVEKYERVKQGDIIGYVGSTGNVRTPQLHFAIKDGKTSLDPQKHLNRTVAVLQ